jgi:hypothetical protein
VNTETATFASKPIVRPVGTGGHTFAVKFGCGGRAEVYQCSREDGSVGWGARVVDDAGETVSYVTLRGYHGDGLADTSDEALADAAVEAFREDSVPAWSTSAEVHELARQGNSDRGTFVKLVKRIARERFGVKLSVRGSRGTAYGWVHISSNDRRSPTLAERIAISTIDGRRSADASIRPCGGERLAVICRLAGHPLPEGFTVTAPQWD